MIKTIINQCWAAYKKNNYMLYCYFKSKLRLEIAKAKMKWVNKMNIKNGKSGNNNSIWNYINELRQGNSKNVLDGIRQMYKYDDLAAADAIGQAYQNFFNKHSPIDNNDDYFHIRPQESDSNSVGIIITPDEVLAVISKLNCKKASGYDLINNSLIMAISQYICLPLCIIYNKSLQTGIYPAAWKYSMVTVIPKKNILDLNNFRPISLLSSMSIIFEKVIMQHLISDYNIYSKLSNQQFAFRRLSSCECAMLSI